MFYLILNLLFLIEFNCKNDGCRQLNTSNEPVRVTNKSLVPAHDYNFEIPANIMTIC